MKHRLLFTVLVVGFALPVAAQTFDDDPCRNQSAGRDRELFCEVREESMAAGPLTVDAGSNGGIRVESWDQNSIRVQAVITAQASSEGRAREIVQTIQLLVGNGRVSASGPERESWSVSYRINVPRRNDLDLRANNGGITISNVSGNIKFDTNNGGVRLIDLAGNVKGETHNGGLNVSLSGSRWDGEGLDVETTNGGVNLQIPAGYNAELETRTSNGGFSIDFPIAVQGELSMNRGIRTTLGSGGPLVRVTTTNGGLKVNRR